MYQPTSEDQLIQRSSSIAKEIFLSGITRKEVWETGVRYLEHYGESIGDASLQEQMALLGTVIGTVLVLSDEISSKDDHLSQSLSDILLKEGNKFTGSGQIVDQEIRLWCIDLHFLAGKWKNAASELAAEVYFRDWDIHEVVHLGLSRISLIHIL